VTDWWNGAVFYQVYPRSFMDADGDGVGDLKGIEARLDYIAGLGVDAVWLSPVFRSPMKDFGYDVADYCDIDPLFGTLADFDAVVRGAHARGLKLIIDQVWSHTSYQHPWFEDAVTGGEHADWYVWAEAKADGSPPNNWLSVFGGSAWTWSPRRGRYYLHNFLSQQPDLNFHNPAVQDAVLDAARFWLERGVDGFRLDVVNYYAHDPMLRDNPPSGARTTNPYGFQRHLFDRSRPETLGFVARLRALLDRYGAMGVGEIFDDAPLERQCEYTEGPDRLHTAYSFFLLDAAQATPALFEQALRAWEGTAGWPSWSLSNHDVVRFPSRFGTAANPDRIKTLLALLLCLRGSPFLFQGDELGLPHADVPYERLQDPFAIAAWTGGSGRDGARTPMPWGAGPNAGFSAASETWLPVDPVHLSLSVEAQNADPNSVLSFLRRFLALRRGLEMLRTGDVLLQPAPDGVLAFERGDESGRMLCLFELAGREARADAPAGSELVEAGLGGRLQAGAIVLPPFAAALLRLRGET
jgi:alpha-glucosidase